MTCAYCGRPFTATIEGWSMCGHCQHAVVQSKIEREDWEETRAQQPELLGDWDDEQ